MVSYLIARSKGIWPFVILGVVAFGVVLYVAHTMTVSLGVQKPHKKNRYTKIRKTEKSNEFKELYNYIEMKHGNELEINRKKLIKSIIICIVLFTISFILYVFLRKLFDIGFNNGYRRGRMLGLVFLPAGFYYIYKYKKYNEIYVNNFKNKVIKEFVEHINNKLKYYRNGGKHLYNFYLEAKFENNVKFNSFLTDDYIEGYNEDGTSIQMSNISLENVNSKGETLNVVYDGIFSVSQINNYLTKEIRIKKNEYIIKKQNKVEMDSKEFEKYFDVYSESNILAMEILTHDVMQELTEFYDTYKIKFETVIKNNNIYIKFDTGVMFEPNILKKSNDINSLWIYYNVLNFVTNLTIKINKLLKDLEV